MVRGHELLSVQRPSTAGPGSPPKTPHHRPMTPGSPNTARTRKSRASTAKTVRSSRSLGSHSSMRSRSPASYSRVSVYNIPPITTKAPQTRFRQMSSVTLCLSEVDQDAKKMEEKYAAMRDSRPRRDEEEATRNEEKKVFDNDMKKLAAQMDMRRVEVSDLRSDFVETTAGSVQISFRKFSEVLLSRGLCDENVCSRLFIYLAAHQASFDFRQFLVQTINAMGVNDIPFYTKLGLFYAIFDTNCDGGLSRMELYRVLKSGILSNLQHKDLIKYVGIIFQEAALYTESTASKISLDELCEICTHSEKVKDLMESCLNNFDLNEAAKVILENDGKPRARLVDFDLLSINK